MGVLLKYTTYLLRRTAKKCPQRILDTPAVLFCLTPCICIVYFKRLTESLSLSFNFSAGVVKNGLMRLPCIPYPFC